MSALPAPQPNPQGLRPEIARIIEALAKAMVEREDRERSREPKAEAA